MYFRKAIISDLEEMKQLFVTTIQTVCANDYDTRQIETWTSSVNNQHRWLDVIENQVVLLAIVETKIVGFGTLKNGNYIDFFYVHKDFQKQGIAHSLLMQLEAEAILQNSKILTSDISITAKPFFEKQGFIVVKKQINIRNEIELINYKMQKNL